MKEIKQLDEAAYNLLMERNPNSRCKEYFEMEICSAAFENGICQSFNSRIITARCNPIIIMFEDIRIYIMQRMWFMNKLSFDLEDRINPSVRRQLEIMKKLQR